MRLGDFSRVVRNGEGSAIEVSKFAGHSEGHNERVQATPEDGRRGTSNRQREHLRRHKAKNGRRPRNSLLTKLNFARLRTTACTAQHHRVQAPHPRDIVCGCGGQNIVGCSTLKTEAAHELTFKFLDSPNADIRIHCGIVAAMRWPDEFLNSGQGQFSDREYADLLALIAKRHADQGRRVSVKVTPSAMAEASTRIDQRGLRVFGLPGAVLSFF